MRDISMKAIRFLLTGVLLSAAASQISAATIFFSFDSSVLMSSGGTVTFFGTLTNTGSARAYLTGDSWTFPLPVDDTAFFTTVPSELAAGESTSGALFDVMVPEGTALGLYTGTFEILGGDSPGAQMVLASESFGVQVVPEPSSFLLVASAAGLVFLRRPTADSTKRC
jgi:hypothetical protein